MIRIEEQHQPRDERFDSLETGTWFRDSDGDIAFKVTDDVAVVFPATDDSATDDEAFPFAYLPSERCQIVTVDALITVKPAA